MKRSRFVGLSVLVVAALIAPVASVAQTVGGIHRVGVIYLGGHHQVIVDGLRQGLRDLGLEEGKHVVFDLKEIKSGDWAAVGPAARDLERAHVELIYTVTTQVTIAAKKATTQVPIVFYVGVDPVAAGLVESFAKPGGRLSGVHSLSRDLTVKRMEILKEMVPKIHRVVTFYDDRETISKQNANLANKVAQQMGVQLVQRNVDSVEEMRAALQGLTSGGIQAYFHTPGGTATSQSLLTIDAARAKRLPTMFHDTSLVARGALAAYGHNYLEIGRLSAKHVQRILAGVQPRDLPVENYDKVGLALNLRTAREIGLTIPPSVRFRADQVIE